MIHITKVLNDYILQNILNDSGIEEIFNDVFPIPEGECLISRHDPSNAKVKEYIDGSTTGVYQIAYYMRSKNPLVCRTVLNAILNGINGKSISNENSVIDLDCQTLPNFISVDDKNQTIYTIEVNASFTTKE